MYATDEKKEKTASRPVLSPHLVAEIYGALGWKDEAFTWLNKAYDEHDPQIVSLKVTPTLDPLRSDPRFIELVRRVGLPN